MAEYSATVTPELVVEAKRSSSSLWMLLLKKLTILKEKKDGEQTRAELKKQGRELDTKWQSSMTTNKNKCFEAEMSFKTFKPSFLENIWSTETVPSLTL